MIAVIGAMIDVEGDAVMIGAEEVSGRTAVEVDFEERRVAVVADGKMIAVLRVARWNRRKAFRST
ncbi:MAG: hypothetical protein ACPGAP_00245 [Akkermansiaceae bacterium]